MGGSYKPRFNRLLIGLSDFKSRRLMLANFPYHALEKKIQKKWLKKKGLKLIRNPQSANALRPIRRAESAARNISFIIKYEIWNVKYLVVLQVLRWLTSFFFLNFGIFSYEFFYE